MLGSNQGSSSSLNGLVKNISLRWEYVDSTMYCLKFSIPNLLSPFTKNVFESPVCPKYFDYSSYAHKRTFGMASM